MGWLAWRDRRVLALLLPTRPTTRSACVGHVTSRPTVSRVSKWALLDISCRGLTTDFFSMPLIILHAPNPKDSLIKDSIHNYNI